MSKYSYIQLKSKTKKTIIKVFTSKSNPMIFSWQIKGKKPNIQWYEIGTREKSRKKSYDLLQSIFVIVDFWTKISNVKNNTMPPRRAIACAFSVNRLISNQRKTRKKETNKYFYLRFVCVNWFLCGFFVSEWQK